MLPSYFKLQYSSQSIEEVVEKLGKGISDWAQQTHQESGQDVIAIPVLRGGIFFFADLVRHIDASVEIAPIRTWAYEIGQNEVQRSEVGVNMDGVVAEGRSVLLVDDICDSGSTLKKLEQVFCERGAAEVRSAVLIKRHLEVEAFQPDWIGFEYKGEEWFVGYGMEDSERWRNLPDIYTIRKEEN